MTASCYFPGCRTATIVFIEGMPITNVQIAHIRGANPGSSRFDPAMSDEDRASFDNLLLLCKPHHDLVDRIDPDRFPVHELKEWKTAREAGSTDVLHDLDGVSEARLAQMLEDATRAAGPQRVVTLEVAGGVLLEGHGVVVIPLDGWHTILDLNPAALTGELLLISTARNVGGLGASIDSFSIYFGFRLDKSQPEMSLLGRNDFPSLNPLLPARVDVGGSSQWLTSLKTFELVISQASKSGLEVSAFRAEVALGSGERISSGWYPTAGLPLDAM